MDPRFQDIRAGFPPKPIEVADATKLADLGLAAREQVVLEKLTEPRPLAEAKLEAPSAEPPAKKAAADEAAKPTAADPPGVVSM